MSNSYYARNDLAKYMGMDEHEGHDKLEEQLMKGSSRRDSGDHRSKFGDKGEHKEYAKGGFLNGMESVDKTQRNPTQGLARGGKVRSRAFGGSMDEQQPNPNQNPGMTPYTTPSGTMMIKKGSLGMEAPTPTAARANGGQLMPHDKGGEIDQKVPRRNLGGILNTALQLAPLFLNEGGEVDRDIPKKGIGGLLKKSLNLGSIMDHGLQGPAILANAVLPNKKGGRIQARANGGTADGAPGDGFMQAAQGLADAAKGLLTMSQQLHGSAQQAAAPDQSGQDAQQGMDQSPVSDYTTGQPQSQRRGGRTYAAGGTAKFRRGEYY